jgi:23S rRNA pseudouridine1911/1915/1917 synthase
MESKIKKVYEDEDILVLDKPCGLIVNRSNTTSEETLQDLLDDEYSFNVKEDVDEISADTDDFAGRSGIVHRLDKETSGVLVIAKNNEAFLNLTKQFKDRKSVKEYVAVLYGKVTNNIIEVDAPLARSPKNPMKLAVSEGGKEAFTRFEKLKEFEIEDVTYSLMKVNPKTGRTHQIRVHASAIGYPIAGDSIYCTRKVLELTLKHFGRMMLHACKLGFYHPKTGNFIEFTSSIPENFHI